MQYSIPEQAKVAEQDYLLRFLEKLKPYSKLVSETERQVFNQN